jgi:anaerobic ribonucleoside-triphosphate reductase activating protein
MHIMTLTSSLDEVFYLLAISCKGGFCLTIVLLDEIKQSIIDSLCDGEGLRLVVFMAGCTHQCKGCHNPTSWDIQNGVEYSIEAVKEAIIARLKEGYYRGVTISGGDPFFQREALYALLNELKEWDALLNVWCYTGYYFTDIQDVDALRLIDVLVDGPFELEKQYPKKKFCGSYNQSIINLNGRWSS